MRYFWALLAYVTAIVVAAASCGGTGKGTGLGNTGANGGSGASSNGGGGSTGVGITFTDAGNGGQNTGGEGGTCPAYLGDCKQQNLNCGKATDGCGNIIDCGMCTDPTQACGIGGTANVCATIPCVPGTCQSLGYDCGTNTDGCGGTLNCPACTPPQTCGTGNKCGNGTCVPTTCAAKGWDCGMQGDGCGLLLNCGMCAANQACGSNGMCTTICTPKTCAMIGAQCGAQSDGCGGIVMCGACGGNQTCQGVGASAMCGTSASCTGLCLKQTTCPGNGTTSVSGTVYAPQGTDPLPNTLVYVPNGAVGAPTYGVQAFVDGVNPPHCDCGSDVSGNPLVSAVTDYAGNFTLTNMPVGANIPIVIQNGRWRRKMTISNVPQCVNTPLPSSGAQQLRMPRVQHETDPADNIPKMGFVTGSVDALECVLRKIGIADSQFNNPNTTGRVQFYLGDSFAGGATYGATSPDESQLWGNQNTINGYDMAFFACKGSEYDRTAAAQSTVINYANAGGRVFATHYSYVWLFNDVPWSGTANWAPDPYGFNTFAADPQTGYINTTFPKGMQLAQWLKLLYPGTVQGQIQINTLRDDFTGVIAPSLLWIHVQDPFLGNVPMHYTFNTPVGVPAANQCGRVLYDDFHVEDAVTSGYSFPQECTNATMTPQEKLLEFMIFDLGSCVTPPVCVPTTCAAQGAMCGQVGDGCGNNVLNCGTCPSGQTCIGGVCSGNGCVPKTCADQGFMCGMQGDGCGNSISCGNCPSGQTCGGSGMVGQCGNGTCVPTTCAAKGVKCGAIGDGCGNLLNCGTCPSGQICGGGVNPMPGVCGMNPCTPKTCTQLGYNCGSASDGCGNIINCGQCSGTQTCGGGGSPNKCGGGAG